MGPGPLRGVVEPAGHARTRGTGGPDSEMRHAATMPSPPTAPGTVTDPREVSEPSRPMRKASTWPAKPAWT